MHSVIRPRSVAVFAAVGVLTVSGVASAGSGPNAASVPDTSEPASDTRTLPRRTRRRPTANR